MQLVGDYSELCFISGIGNEGLTHAGSLHDWSFGSENLVASIAPRFLSCEARKNRRPGFFDRAGSRNRLNPQQRQRRSGEKVRGSRAARELYVPVKNAAKPLFFLKFEAGKTHRVTVHQSLTHSIVGVVA